MRVENKIQQLFLEKDQVSLQKDILPIILEEFKLLQINEEMFSLGCEFVKQQLYAVHISGIEVVCYPVFSGDPSNYSLSVVDMIWEVIKR